jgi:glycosyltransferase involved in cell wall biosynthesis
MKILISTGIFPNRFDVNFGIYNLKQTAALKNYGDVMVIAPVPYFPSSLKFAGYQKYSRIPRSDRIQEVNIHYPRCFVTPKILRSMHGLFLLVSTFRFYRKYIKRERFDAILGFFAYPFGFANACLGKIFKIPVFVSCRGSDINYLTKQRLRRKAISWALKNSTGVFCVSEDLRSKVIALGVAPDKVSVIPNGIETDRFKRMDQAQARADLGLDAAARILICTSRLDPEKGIDVLVDAFSLVEEDDVQLIIAGWGTEEKKLRSQVERLELHDRIRFAGNIPHHEVPKWLNAADLFVITSRNEGYPNALVEAMACGLPIVAARVGGVPEIITSSEIGLMVEAENPRAAAEAISLALTKKWDRDMLSRVAHQRSWVNVAGDIAARIGKATGIEAAAGNSQSQAVKR